MLFLMCGPAFSEKSTLARALSRKGAVRIALDGILCEQGLVPGEGLPIEAWEGASKTACERILSAHAEGRDIVLDDTLCYRFLRDRYRGLAEEHGIPFTLVVLRIDQDDVRRRVAENTKTKARDGIRPGVLDSHLERFEWPGPDEVRVELDGTAPTEKHLQKLGL